MSDAPRDWSLNGVGLSRSYSMGAAATPAFGPASGVPTSLSQLRANLMAFGITGGGTARGNAESSDGRPLGGISSGAPGLRSSWSFDWGAAKKGGADGMPSLLPWGGSEGESFGYHRRLRSFVLLMLLGGLNFAMAGLFLPLVLIRPGKFSLFFTLGNCLVLASFAVLRGAREQAQHLLAWARLPFTLAYVGSMCLTLYSALVAHSYLLVLCSAGAQLVALCYYAASYLPGGTRAVRLFGAMAARLVQQLAAAVGLLCCGRRRSGARERRGDSAAPCVHREPCRPTAAPFAHVCARRSARPDPSLRCARAGMLPL